MTVRTLGEIRLEIRHELGEADTEEEPLWSNAYLNQWINRYAYDVVKETKCLQGYGSITTTINLANYPLPTNHCQPILVKRGNDVPIDPIEIDDLRNINITISGSPNSYLMFANEIYFYPKPATVETINLWSYKVATYMSVDATPFDVEDEAIIEIIEKLVIARARKVEEEFGVANQYYSEVPYNISDYKFVNRMKQHQKNNMVKDVMKYRS